MMKIGVNVWYMEPAPRIKIWTQNEKVYAEVDGVDYVEAISVKAPPSLLYVLVDIFELECGGEISRSPLKHSNINVNVVEKMTRSGSRIKISFDATWVDNNKDYTNKDIGVVFVLA